MNKSLINLNGTDLTVLLFALQNYEVKLNQAILECNIPECRSRHFTYLEKTRSLAKSVNILLKETTGVIYE